tara:strand:+ start:605555 stop:608506 length:2952 start_codon:yes stop_codon:yes gene_type:complete
MNTHTNRRIRVFALSKEHRSRRRRILCLSPVFVLLFAVGTQGQDVSFDDAPASKDAIANKEKLDFFESKIRPALVKHCYACHSAEADKIQGGLLLDSRSGLLQGGDSGPAIVVGEPDESLLIEALKHESFEMPPDKRLSDKVIDDFRHWVRTGAIDPREPSAGAAKRRRVLYQEMDAESHWAFQPIRHPDPPELDDPWVKTPIDAFILKRLRDAGLEPSPRADRRTLLRRASYDLRGLPPTLKEIQRLAGDSSSNAVSDAIDRLLESKHYGEKWARHWLDIARYADNNGERLAPSRDPPYYPFAWAYRDYVIDAMNRDLPFDQFVLEQIAGDTIATTTDRRPYAGLGFNRVGKTFGGNLDDRIDDRIDAVSKCFLGLSVACARCHDHKLDPISQADYYALHGVFSSSEETTYLLHDTAGTDAYRDFVRQKDQMTSRLYKQCRDRLNEFMQNLTLQVADYLIGTEKYRDGELQEELVTLASREVGLQPNAMNAWLNALQRLQEEAAPAYLPWFAFADLPESSFAILAGELAAEVGRGSCGGRPVPALVAKRFRGQTPKSLRDVAEIYQRIFQDVEQAADGRYPIAELLASFESSPQRFLPEYYDHPALPPPLSDPELESLRQVTIGLRGPYFMSPRELMQLGAGDIYKTRVREMHEVAKFEGEHLGAPVRVMGFRDADSPADSPLYIRGDSQSPGDLVPRRFLERLCQDEPKPFTQGSGRRELADAIVSHDNPLTARVIVNRVWLWHFGRGIVSTPSDFGLSGDPPSHPELLDWLASWFVDEGWSLKKLNRLIMNSNVYQQASLPREDAMQLDAENVLLWRFSPRRMTFEEMRDTWLFVAGTLSRDVGGRPVDAVTDATRRSIYLYIDRYKLPDIFSNFDFANPEMTTAQRDTTIVAQQSLFKMNSGWLLDRARDLAARPEVQRAKTPAAKAQALYKLVYQRSPDQTELDLAVNFLREASIDNVSTVPRLAHALLQTNQLLYVQ